MTKDAEQIEVTVPLAFYEWLATIEPDVTVRDLAPQEIADLLLRLAHSTPAPDGPSDATKRMTGTLGVEWVHDPKWQPAAPEGEVGELVERLRKLAEVRSDFVAKREAMNAARPDPMHGTPAERALYDERYRADHEAERALFREAQDFAMWAADNQAADTILSLQSRIALLEEAGEGLCRLVGFFSSVIKSGETFTETCRDDRDRATSAWRAARKGDA